MMLAAAQWGPVVESNVSTFFIRYNGIILFTFTLLTDTFTIRAFVGVYFGQ